MAKKTISRFVVGLLVLIITTSTVQAHVGDYWLGSYTSNAPSHPSDMQFMYSSSSLGGYYTSTVFGNITDWNSISSNVNLSLTYRAPGMPSSLCDQFYQIYNESMTYLYGFNFTSQILGQTCPTDVTGNSVSVNSNWYKVAVFLNTSSPYITSSAQAKKVFLHEIGHCLKLAHPVSNTTYHGTLYGGLPYAIMNQGIPASGTAVAPTIQQHDIDNLLGRWGT